MKKTKNKRAWIKILEAFIAIIFVIVILSVVVLKDENKKQDFSQEIYEKQEALLRIIQLNESLRESIVEGVESGVPVPNSEDNFPENLNETLNANTPELLECISNICSIYTDCSEISGLPSNKNIYIRSMIIFSTPNDYDPKTINLFCWKK